MLDKDQVFSCYYRLNSLKENLLKGKGSFKVSSLTGALKDYYKQVCSMYKDPVLIDEFMLKTEKELIAEINSINSMIPEERRGNKLSKERLYYLNSILDLFYSNVLFKDMFNNEPDYFSYIDNLNEAFLLEENNILQQQGRLIPGDIAYKFILKPYIECLCLYLLDFPVEENYKSHFRLLLDDDFKLWSHLYQAILVKRGFDKKKDWIYQEILGVFNKDLALLFPDSWDTFDSFLRKMIELNEKGYETLDECYSIIGKELDSYSFTEEDFIDLMTKVDKLYYNLREELGSIPYGALKEVASDLFSILPISVVDDPLFLNRLKEDVKLFIKENKNGKHNFPEENDFIKEVQLYYLSEDNDKKNSSLVDKFSLLHRVVNIMYEKYSEGKAVGAYDRYPRPYHIKHLILNPIRWSIYNACIKKEVFRKSRKSGYYNYDFLSLIHSNKFEFWKEYIRFYFIDRKDLGLGAIDYESIISALGLDSTEEREEDIAKDNFEYILNEMGVYAKQNPHLTYDECLEKAKERWEKFADRTSNLDLGVSHDKFLGILNKYIGE